MVNSPYATLEEEQAHEQPLDPDLPPWRHLPIAYRDSDNQVVVERGPFPALREFLASRQTMYVLDKVDVRYVLLRNRLGQWAGLAVGSGVAPGVDYRPSEEIPWPDPAHIQASEDGTFTNHRLALQAALARLTELEADGWVPVQDWPAWMVDEASR